MEFRQIRYALSVAKERSFTAAARRLNISQSAVSEQVHLLEEEIGFSLFRRTPRGIELTEQGRRSCTKPSGWSATCSASPTPRDG